MKKYNILESWGNSWITPRGLNAHIKKWLPLWAKKNRRKNRAWLMRKDGRVLKWSIPMPRKRKRKRHRCLSLNRQLLLLQQALQGSIKGVAPARSQTRKMLTSSRLPQKSQLSHMTLAKVLCQNHLIQLVLILWTLITSRFGQDLTPDSSWRREELYSMST